jgi:hypothetical protein
MGDIPLVADYSAENTCVICGQPGETHHWAPQAMSEQFGDDWFHWPVCPLCQGHHRLWHQIVTPELTG